MRMISGIYSAIGVVCLILAVYIFNENTLWLTLVGQENLEMENSIIIPFFYLSFVSVVLFVIFWGIYLEYREFDIDIRIVTLLSVLPRLLATIAAASLCVTVVSLATMQGLISLRYVTVTLMAFLSLFLPKAEGRNMNKYNLGSLILTVLGLYIFAFSWNHAYVLILMPFMTFVAIMATMKNKEGCL